MYIFIFYSIFPSLQIIVMPHLILSRLFQPPFKGRSEVEDIFHYVLVRQTERPCSSFEVLQSGKFKPNTGEQNANAVCFLKKKGGEDLTRPWGSIFTVPYYHSFILSSS